jgi:hypothetical protein
MNNAGSRTTQTERQRPDIPYVPRIESGDFPVFPVPSVVKFHS